MVQRGVRLDKLGILDDAGTDIRWYRSRVTEGEKLVGWAENYRVKDFATLKSIEDAWKKISH